MNALDTLALASCLALAVDILLQIRRIRQTRSSNDLSILGITIRYVAIVVILIKFVSLHDVSLIIGQGIVVATFTGYLVLVLTYFKHRR